MIPQSQHRSLGTSGIMVSPLGVGTNRWRQGTNDEAVFQSFVSSLDVGVTFFDTAEVYSGGKSEQLLGDCVHKDQRPVVLASKFAPLPTRLSRGQFIAALDASLRRLRVPVIDLYYIHFPFTFIRVETLMDWMAQAVQAGKVRAVGVSNFTAAQMRRAADHLARYDIPLAANEVHYSLAHRQPERNGVLEACRELDVALVAYRPLESSLLTSSARGGEASASVTKLQEALSTVAHERGASVSQVALSWLLRRDSHIIPIPGATSPRHALENAAALIWELSAEEFASIDRASSR
jgi:aryl-alcohol dehydrogenase-like predicted oxidoreductase